jgi:hypothetical protein
LVVVLLAFPVRPRPPPPTTTIAASQSSASPPSAEVQRTYRALLVAAGYARDRYRSAVEAETAQWSVCQRAAAPTIALESAGGIDLRPGELDSQSSLSKSRPIPIGAVSILTLLSIFAGVVAARRVKRPPLTFASAEEIEAVLDLPVLGRLGSETDRPGRNAA